MTGMQKQDASCPSSSMGPSTCRARTGCSLFLSAGAQHRVCSGPPAQSSFQNHLAMPRPQHLSAQQSTGSLLSHWFVSISCWQPGAFPAELLTFAFFFQMPWGRSLSASKKDRSQWRRETPSTPPAHTKHLSSMACIGTSRRKAKPRSWSHIRQQQAPSTTAVSPRG